MFAFPRSGWCSWLFTTNGNTDLELSCRTYDVYGSQISSTQCQGDHTVIYDANRKDREDCNFNLNYRSVAVRLNSRYPAIYFTGYGYNTYQRSVKHCQQLNTKTSTNLSLLFMIKTFKNIMYFGFSACLHHKINHIVFVSAKFDDAYA